MNIRLLVCFFIATLTTLLSACQPAADDGEAKSFITVYSARADYLIDPLFQRFTEQTGIEVRYITDTEAALIARLQAEGENTPADLMLTVDAGNLWHAETLGLFKSVDSDVLSANVPAHFRSVNDQWFGLSLRARTLVYSTSRVDPNLLPSYESLADEQWRNRLCLRTAKKVYNQSLVASLIVAHGEAETEQIVRGWVENLAFEPLSNDVKVIEAIQAGACDVGIVNTYYFGRMEAVDPDIPVAIHWPNQAPDQQGTHVNVSGAGLTRWAPHPELALQLLEWLSSEEAQLDFAGLNKEFPVNPQVPAVEQVQAWGQFRADDVPMQTLGELQADAVRLMDRAGYQ